MAHLGIDASCWVNRRGYGRFARELLNAMLACDERNTYWFFLDQDTGQGLDDLPRGARPVVVSTSRAATEAASADGRRAVRDLWAMGAAVRAHRPRLDAFFFPSVYTYFPVNLPLTRRLTPVVVGIHDATPERYPQLVFDGRLPRLMWALKARLALREAAAVVTVSDSSRRAIAEVYQYPRERIHVAHDAASAIFRPFNGDFGASTRPLDMAELLAAYSIPPGTRYILYVGGISPHKNLGGLLTAFAMSLAKQGPGKEEIKLVLVGDYQRDVFLSSYQAVKQQILDSGLDGKVLFAGFVSDANLVRLYQGAEALVMPSFDEGFGLPAVEAMACGVPVIASRAGALPEVVGDAGLLFDPHQPAELAERLAQVLSQEPLRREMRRRGLARAAEFSWERSARNVVEVLEQVLRSEEHGRVNDA